MANEIHNILQKFSNGRELQIVGIDRNESLFKGDGTLVQKVTKPVTQDEVMQQVQLPELLLLVSTLKALYSSIPEAEWPRYFNQPSEALIDQQPPNEDLLSLKTLWVYTLFLRGEGPGIKYGELNDDETTRSVFGYVPRDWEVIYATEHKPSA